MSTPVDNMVMLRDIFLRDEAWLTTSDLPSDTAVSGLVCADFRGQKVFPKFQFLAAGIPHARARDLMAYLPCDGRGWHAVLWCFAPTRKLGGVRPADAFATDADAVIDAARRDFHGDDCDW